MRQVARSAFCAGQATEDATSRGVPAPNAQVQLHRKLAAEDKMLPTYRQSPEPPGRAYAHVYPSGQGALPEPQTRSNGLHTRGP